MSETIKITEELDRTQKKVAALREIYKLYPDTTVKKQNLWDEKYISREINKDIDIIRFEFSHNWLRAYTSKIIGCIEVNSEPESFLLLQHYPDDLYAQLVVQSYHDTMKKNNIPEEMIREADLAVIRFIKKNDIDLSKSNIKDLNANTTIGKLISLL